MPTKKKLKNIICNTEKENKYFYDTKKGKISLCHPILYTLLEMDRNGADIEKWIQSPDSNEEYTKKNLKYYYKKYVLLKAHGYFSNTDSYDESIPELNADTIKNNLANTRHITFEITDRCNLSCEYCGYGKFYDNYDKRENKNLDIQSAKTFLNYLKDLWNSPLNKNFDAVNNISFYGGEPLLNFPFIEEMVDYSKSINLIQNRCAFIITTNGILLDRYMDFLVKHDFLITISLDGNKFNNSYRVLHNGNESHEQIEKNIKALQKKYPEYFKKRVFFNAVLHNRNSVSDIYWYFKTEFDKIPNILSLNTLGINPLQKENFWKTYNNFNESLQQSKDCAVLEKKLFNRLPDVDTLDIVLHECNDFCFEDYNRFFIADEKTVRYPTATCLPFLRKIFLTTNGKILVCEKIGYEHALGTAHPNNVALDLDEIAEKYNAYYKKMRKLCSSCYNAKTCGECMFLFDITNEKASCPDFMGYSEYSKFLSEQISFIEKKPDTYNKVLFRKYNEK